MAAGLAYAPALGFTAASTDEAPAAGQGRSWILAVDSRPLLRSGLAGLARRALDRETQGVSDLVEAAAAVRTAGCSPDVVLLGLRAGDDPEHLVREARRLRAPVICVVETTSAALVNAALAAGADGYLTLDLADSAALRETVLSTLAGRSVVPVALTRRRSRVGDPGPVTVRGLEVLHSLADGLHDEEIGERLGISTSAVRKHIAASQQRLDARTRTQMVAIAARSGLL